MSVLEASGARSLDASDDSSDAPPPQPDELKAILDAEIATHATIITVIRDCERQLDELPDSLSPQDPTIRDLRHTLSHALLEAGQSKTRQSTLRMQLRSVSGHQRRIEGHSSGLGLTIDRFFEARDESLRMEFAALAQVFDSVANGARMLMRHVVSLCEGMLGQGRRIGRVWSVWEPLRADLEDGEKEDGENLEGGKGEEEKAEGGKKDAE
ncbi:MAG: hypothetical protein ASARMPREDX12_005557 [Alectoria sarmentosa]|nr:MAG: hypothetical protein ASARMPREDX12_005557 [Alectoria sarmentosa]